MRGKTHFGKQTSHNSRFIRYTSVVHHNNIINCPQMQQLKWCQDGTNASIIYAHHQAFL